MLDVKIEQYAVNIDNNSTKSKTEYNSWHNNCATIGISSDGMVFLVMT